ncbi:MAG: cupin domain-containing protein [Actinobacteria bacterium]|nr:cupin domain-containing protein [Actinomycetota bacterium]
MSERVKVIDMSEGRRTDLPGGNFVCELISGPRVGSKDVCLGFSTWKPGASTKQMVHDVEELAFIVEGEGKLSIGDEHVSYRAGQGVLIPAGVPHGVVNDSEADMSMVYVFAHPEYPPTREATPDELHRTSDQQG